MADMIIFGRFGDYKVVWDDDNHEEMIPVIKELLDQGYRFWKLQPRLGGLIPPKKKQIKSVREIKDERVLEMASDEFMKVFAQGIISLEQEPNKNLETAKPLKSPKKIARSKTIATKPLAGG